MTGRAWALFVAMSLLWGLPYLLIKVAVTELDPSFVVFVRLALASIVLLPIAVATGAFKRWRAHWRGLFGVSLIGIVAPFLLIAYGEQHITSSLAALLIAADPLFIVLIALRFDSSERASGRRLLGLFIGILGVAAVVGLNVGGDAVGVLGAALVLLAAVCYAISALLVKTLSDMPRLGSVTATLGLASLMMAPAALVALPSHLPGSAALVSVVALSVLCTAFAYILYFSLIVTAGATRASLITYVNPAVATILGALILSEQITVGTVLGFVLIVLGCALSTSAAARAGRRSESFARS